MNTGETKRRADPLSMEVEEFRQLGHRAIDLVASYLAGTRARAVFSPMSVQERKRLLEESLGDLGRSAPSILSTFEKDILPHSMGNGHPRFFGWVNSPPSPVGILAELLAAAMNPSCAGGDHAAIYVERCAVRWLMELVGFPVEGSVGILVSGGSMASLTCLAAARDWAARKAGWDIRAQGLQTERLGLTLYMSEEAHSCIRKAAELLGVGACSIRSIATDAEYRLDMSALGEAVARDKKAGRLPFAVVGNAGTVNTGGIDPLDELADYARSEGLWFHVDGAYGAISILDPDKTPRYKGLSRADSLALDPHKWMSVPVECGAALVRAGSSLRQAFSLIPPYLRTEEGKGFGGLPWYSEYGFQQTRGFRALKLWMTLQYAGREGLSRHVSKHNRLAKKLGALIESNDEFELLAPISLSIVAFRYKPTTRDLSEEALNLLNKKIMEEVQAGGDAFLSSTLLRGHFALRACILHYDTSESDLESLLGTVQGIGRRLMVEWG